jgi:hypothetical protein
VNVLHGTIAGLLAVILPLVPTAAEAPPYNGPMTTTEFSQVGETEFSYRWVTDQAIAQKDLQCTLYYLCSFADIITPDCPDEVFVELDFFDNRDNLITSGGDVLPVSGQHMLRQVELGTNWVPDFATFDVTNMVCYSGTPTGYGEI